MTIDEKDRITLIKYRIEKTKQAGDDANFLFKNDRLQLAVNRIYYSAFYILFALALKHHFQSSKHQELIGWFNKTFVKDNIVDRKYGKFLHKAYDKRSNADYADYVKFDKEELLVMLNEMNDFLTKVEELIEDDSIENKP